MKKLSITLLLFFSVIYFAKGQHAHFSFEIGVENQGNMAITMNQDSIKLQWENHWTNNGESVDLTNFRIEFFTDSTFQYYQLLADDLTGGVTSIELVLDNGKLYERVISGGSTSVKCTGCPNGCSPRRNTVGDGYCTACDGDGSGSCVKSETLNSTNILSF